MPRSARPLEAPGPANAGKADGSGFPAAVRRCSFSARTLAVGDAVRAVDACDHPVGQRVRIPSTAVVDAVGALAVSGCGTVRAGVAAGVPGAVEAGGSPTDVPPGTEPDGVVVTVAVGPLEPVVVGAVGGADVGTLDDGEPVVVAEVVAGGVDAVDVVGDAVAVSATSAPGAGTDWRCPA